MLIIRAIAASFFFLCASAQAMPGFVVEYPEGPRADSIVFEKIVYTGQCPGVLLDPVRGHFMDSAEPPSPGRRVRIVNLTTGLSSDPYPFTDREYDSGERSEEIDFLPGNAHRQRWFTVVEGLNDFEVYYLAGGKVVQTKPFSFPVEIQTRYEQRDAECRVENDCRPIPPNNGGFPCIPRIVCGCFAAR